MELLKKQFGSSVYGEVAEKLLQESTHQALKEKNIAVTPIGDCTSIGYIHGAIADARNAVLALDDLA